MEIPCETEMEDLKAPNKLHDFHIIFITRDI